MTALALMVIGLALMIPVAFWLGIAIGEERERGRKLVRGELENPRVAHLQGMKPMGAATR